MSGPEPHPRIHGASLAEDPELARTARPLGFNHHKDPPHPTPSAGPSVQHVSSLSRGRCYDRPGKKPAADPEPDPVKLHEKVCKERGGSNFATDWVLTAFKYGVDRDVLLRTLKPQEIIAMNFTGDFQPRQVYDGFIRKVGDQYECGLCKEDKVTYWKAKKDAPRHLRKFHFGLAEACNVWCVPPILALP